MKRFPERVGVSPHRGSLQVQRKPFLPACHRQVLAPDICSPPTAATSCWNSQGWLQVLVAESPPGPVHRPEPL